MTRVHVRPTAKTRKRRRRRRLLTLLAYIVVVFALAWFFESQGTTTVVFVRHADVDEPATAGPNAPLNRVGKLRAELLADYLENIDVVQGVNAIYVDSTVRTQQTAAPIAKRLGLEPEVADHDAVVAFMKNLLFEHKREIILIVTQADDIAPMVEELHGSKRLAEIGPSDYANVYVVSIPWFGKVKTLQHPYANGWVAPGL
jgi:phosphohistidine phosphatase SixA